MAVTLRSYMNAQLKAMGKTVKQAQKDAGKYKSIAAAKKAGSLYYTDKNGKIMAAVYAEDLKKSAPKPKPKPKPNNTKPNNPKPNNPSNPKPDMPKPKNNPNSGMSIKALQLKAKKLRTKIAHARGKGKDDPAAVAELKRINNLIRQKQGKRPR